MVIATVQTTGFTVQSAHFTIHSAQSTLRTVGRMCTVHSAQRTIHSSQCTQRTLCSWQNVQSEQFTVHTVHREHCAQLGECAKCTRADLQCSARPSCGLSSSWNGTTTIIITTHKVMNIMFHFDSSSSNRSSLCHGPLIRDSHPGVQVSLSPEHLHPQTSLLSSDTNPLYSFSFHTVPHLSESRIPRLHFHDMESLVNWIVSV